jgi:hypothetical protein
MAFPTIPTAGANTLLFSVTAAAGTTHTFPSLTTLDNANGDLLIAVIALYQASATGNTFGTWGGSFTEFGDSSSATNPSVAMGAAYKISNGTETGTFTVTSSISGRAAMALMSVKNWHGTTVPEIAFSAATTTTAHDPPSLDPSGWGSEDTLWVAVAGSGQTSLTGSWTGIGSAPTNYTDYGESAIAGGDVVGAAQIAVAFRQLAAASDDPGAFTTDTSPEIERAATIAVRPAAAPQTISGGVASEADAALAATVSQPQAPVSGGVASEADSGPAATVSQPQAPVAGGVASEADSAPAATVDQGSGVFSPDDIAGLECWLKADAIGLSDGANVTTWEDSHTSNKDATGATGQTFETNEINGLPVVRFDGTDDKMTVSGITNNDATRTIFMVARAQSHTTGDAFWGFVANAEMTMAGNGTVRWSTNQAVAVQSLTGAGTAGSTVRVITLRFNSTSSADGYDGAGAAQNFDPNDVYQSGTSPLVLGARASTAFGNVDIAEFLVFDSALVDADLDDVRNYLLDKWINAPQTISAGVASEADSAPAATVSQPQAPVSGGVASEADSVNAATVSQPQAPVAGGVASEADSAPAATVDQAFSPTDIAGLECWLKADAIGLSDGANVTTWEDSHTSNNDATNSTGQTLETNEINGLPVVRFDGTDDRLLVSGITNNDATRTFFMVARVVSAAVNDAFWGFGSSSVMNMTGAGAVRWGVDQAAAQVNIDATGGVGTVRLITLRFNGTSSADAYSLDGAAINFDPADQYQATGTTLVLGARGTTAYGNVEIGEFLVFDSALSDTDLDDVRSYLTDKWLSGPQTVSGGVATEADSTPAATISQPQAPVAAGTAQEADSANAATVVQPQAPVSGGTASEADSAPAGTVSQPQAPVSGGVASESDSAVAGTVSQPQPPVQAGVASEADSAPAATVDQAAGDQTILAGVASEVDSVPAATPTGGAQPPDTNPELGGVVSEPTLGGVFDESVTGGTFAEPSHGGNVTEPTLNGVFDETTTGGDVTEPDEGAEIDNLLGGVIDEVLTNGSVTEPSINGNVTEPALNGNVTEPDLGALLDEAIRSSQIDEATRSGTPEESTRGGTIDEVLTGGEIF